MKILMNYTISITFGLMTFMTSDLYDLWPLLPLASITSGL